MSHHEVRALSPEHLSEELSWLRALARKLVRDPEAADDLVQDAMVVALERGGGGRAWLTGVLRKLDLRRRRSDGRRAHRERRGARPEAVSPADELSAELAAQGQLVRSVLALDEPYRHTLLRRFYLERQPRAIAAEDGVSVNTVNSRLQRGLAQLRERMDDAHGGDRSAWCVALMPLVARPAAPALPLIGSALTVKATLVLSSAAALAAVALLFPDREPETAQVASLDPPPALESGLDAVAPEDVTPPDPAVGSGPAPLPEPASSRLAAPRATEPAPTVAPPTLVRVRGLVVDIEGRFVPDVELRASSDGPPIAARSASDGTFELSAPIGAELAIVADESDLVTVQQGAWAEGAIADPVVVVADATRVAGRVVDLEQNPIPGVRVELRGPADLTSRIGLELSGSSRIYWHTTTDAFGRFTVTDAPVFVDGLLDLSHPEYASRLVPVPQLGADRLEVVLQPPTLLGELAIRGQVLARDGRPVPGSFVRSGATVVPCDDRGLFELDPVRALGTDELVALAPGHQPGRMDRPGAATDTDTGWPEFVTLTLGPESLAIEGRLVDGEGEPLVGARVWPGDAERFGAIGAFPLTLEGLTAGQSLPDGALANQRDMPTEPGDDRFGWYSWRGTSDAMWAFVTTDADGRFRLEGLQDRAYTLGVLPMNPLESLEVGPIAAGTTGGEWVVPIEPSLPTLRGKVVDELGEPLEGIRIQPYEVTMSPERVVLGGTTRMNLLYSDQTAVSEAGGAFELTDVPTDGMTLWMLGDGILPTPAYVEGPLEAEGLVLELPCRRRLQVELLDPELADGFEVRDAQGRVLYVYELQVGQTMSFSRAVLADGRSAVLSVGLASAELVLFDGDEAVAELPLELSAEGLTTVRY